MLVPKRVRVSVIIFKLLLLFVVFILTSVAKEQQQLRNHVGANEKIHSKIYFNAKATEIHINKRIQPTSSHALIISHSGHLAEYDPPKQTWGNRHIESIKSKGEDNLGLFVKKHMTIQLRVCIGAILIYLVIGAIAYSIVLENWSIIDSLYFSVVTFTTVGYGDLSPTTELSKLFTTFYSLGGISILGVALGIIGSRVAEYETKLISKLNEIASDFNLFTLNKNRNEINQVKESSSADAKSAWLPLWKAYVPVLAVLLLGSVVVARMEGWGYMNAFYFCTLTAVTVGYGDEVHSTKRMRTLAILYIPILVGVMSHFLGTVARVIMDVHRNSLLQHMQNREWKPNDLRDMDSDGDGIVTEADFIVFMLSNMQDVDNRLLDRLRKHFRSLAHRDLHVTNNSTTCLKHTIPRVHL